MILRYLGRKDWALFLASIVFIVLQVYLDLQIPGYMNNITYALETHESSEVIIDFGLRMIICAPYKVWMPMSSKWVEGPMSS